MGNGQWLLLQRQLSRKLLGAALALLPVHRRVFPSVDSLFSSPLNFSMLPDTTLMKGSDEKLDHASDEVVHPPSQDLKESLVGSVEEKRLVRKLDVRILPITCLLYLCACTCVLYSIHSSRNIILTPTCSFGQIKHWECAAARPPGGRARRR